MADELTLDVQNLAEFQATLQEYAEVSGKDHADALNHQLKNLAYRAVKHAPKAVPTAISALYREYPLIAYILRRHVEARNAGPAQPISVRGRKRKKVVRGSGRFYTRMEAKEFAKKWVAKKKRAVNFMKAFFLAAGRTMQRHDPISGSVPASDTGGYHGITVEAMPATAGNLNSEFRSMYRYAKRSEKTASSAERILLKSINAAIPETIVDMEKYIQRKAEERARQYSAA